MAHAIRRSSIGRFRARTRHADETRRASTVAMPPVRFRAQAARQRDLGEVFLQFRCSLHEDRGRATETASRRPSLSIRILSSSRTLRLNPRSPRLSQIRRQRPSPLTSRLDRRSHLSRKSQPLNRRKPSAPPAKSGGRRGKPRRQRDRNRRSRRNRANSSRDAAPRKENAGEPGKTGNDAGAGPGATASESGPSDPPTKPTEDR